MKPEDESATAAKEPEVAVRFGEISQTIQSYTYPLLELDAYDRPDVFASGVFLEVDGVVYLVSAAHALNTTALNIMTRGRQRLISLRATSRSVRRINGTEFDIAALAIDRAVVCEHEIRTIPAQMLAASIDLSSPHCRAFCGYPVSKNKPADTVRRDQRSVALWYQTYFGTASFPRDHREFDKSPDTHVGLYYGDARDPCGRTVTTLPSPKGTSGGGAWLIPDLERPDRVFLEGIVIECHRKKFVFATRIECVVAFIRAFFFSLNRYV